MGLLSQSSTTHPLMLLLVLLALAQKAAEAYTYTSWHECSAQSVYGGSYGAEVLGNLSDFRSNLLSKVWQSFDPTVPYLEGHARFNPFKPFIRCPPHQPLIRYGNEADGGKLLCDVSKLPTPCLIYSLGSNGDYSFERDMLNVTKCEIHTFDCTYDGESQDPARHHYHKWCVGGQAAPNFKTWDQITKELGHQHRTLDVFKIDIEGHEPGVIAELKHNTALPRQIVIEIHLRPKEATAIQKPAPRTPAQLALLMMHFAGLGYGIVGQEDNIWGESGCCAEWTFLHVERPWAGPGARLATYTRSHRRPSPAAATTGAGGAANIPALEDGSEMLAPAAAGASGRRLRMQEQQPQQLGSSTWLPAGLSKLWRRL